MVTFADILAARERIQSGIELSPCPHSKALSDLLGCDVYCKLESLQRTGSFKERGARNALLLLDEAARRRGVIAASAGNHALALAYHGSLLNAPVTVVMPRFAPLIKQANCRKLGAEVVLHGESFAQAREKADKLRAERNLTYIHGFDDDAVIAGQGTLALEVLEQVPAFDAVVIPIGGGGLIAGCALAFKTLEPHIEVIGVESTATASFTASQAAGKPTAVPMQATLADGLAVSRVGANAFALAREHVDRVVTVTEDALASALVRLMEVEKTVVEGAAAAPLAALVQGKLEHLRGKRVVLVLSGGNLDLTVMPRLIESALIADGRLLRFTATISDRPGGLAKLTQLLAEAEVSVKDVFHDRAFSGSNVAAVNVVCTVETRDYAHQAELFHVLQSAGIPIVEQAYCGTNS